jgi:tRNA threonylcarbamoyladenosine modification (KEOPS) complex  Pcc1 subunit
MDGGDCVVETLAADSSALRAAVNSCLECVRIVEDIGRITR